MWEEWHCYASPLKIYKQDYEVLLGYFNKIYPIQDAFDGALEPVFDVCFDNWIGKSDWHRIMDEIERDLNRVDSGQKRLLTDFLAWVKKALQHTSVMIAEGNL